MMLWEIVACSRIYRSFSGFESDADLEPGNIATDCDGKKTVDMRLIGQRLAGGQRPGASAGCPLTLYKLMQACWVATPTARPAATEVSAELIFICKRLRRRRWQTVARRLLEHATRPPRRSSSLQPEPEPEPVPEPEPEPETETERETETEPTASLDCTSDYHDFLERLGLLDWKEPLTEYLTAGADELTELKQMDETELKEDILEDLGLDEQAQSRFVSALRALREMEHRMEELSQQMDYEDSMDRAWAKLQLLLHPRADTEQSRHQLLRLRSRSSPDMQNK